MQQIYYWQSFTKWKENAKNSVEIEQPIFCKSCILLFSFIIIKYKLIHTSSLSASPKAIACWHKLQGWACGCPQVLPWNSSSSLSTKEMVLMLSGKVIQWEYELTRDTWTKSWRCQARCGAFHINTVKLILLKLRNDQPI